jgi:hypothetical protein
MLRFGFIIPLRPKSESADWLETIRLLNRSIGSVLRQTYTRLTIYVIYTDQPAEKMDDPRVKYISCPFPFQRWDDLKNGEHLLSRMKTEEKAVRRWDKGRKLSYAAKLAKEDNCDYIMALDADDLLSKYFLASLIQNGRQTNCAGWFLDMGYVYSEGSSFLLQVPKHMCGLNGSTHVLRNDLVRIPDFMSLTWEDYNLFTDHGWVRMRMKQEYGAELEAVPQPMLIYLVHHSNMSGVYQKEFGFHLKAIVKRLLRSKPLTTRLRDEYFLLKN